MSSSSLRPGCSEGLRRLESCIGTWTDAYVARSGLGTARTNGPGAGRLVQVRALVAGRILRIQDPSERVVAAGSPLLTLGDLDRLEVVIELLPSEAVKVKAGLPVLVEGWGGDKAPHAKVRLVEPYAATKVSALGIEEKRTNVVRSGRDDTQRSVRWNQPIAAIRPTTTSAVPRQAVGEGDPPIHPNDRKVAETVSSKSGSHRQLMLRVVGHLPARRKGQRAVPA